MELTPTKVRAVMASPASPLDGADSSDFSKTKVPDGYYKDMRNDTIFESLKRCKLFLDCLLSMNEYDRFDSPQSEAQKN